MANYTNVEEDIQDFFDGVLKQQNIPLDVKFLLLSCSNLKKLVKLKKMNDAWAFSAKSDILVEINPEYFDSFDDEIKTILLEQEFGRIDFNFEKGTLKLKKNDFTSDKGVCEKYTFEKVKRAIETEEMLAKQKQEKENESKQTKTGGKKNWKK